MSTNPPGGKDRHGTSRVWLRRLVYALAALGLVVVLLAMAASLALRRPGVQQTVIEGISESVEERFNLSLAAGGFDLGLVRGRLDVRDLELRAGEGEPFARIGSVRILFRPTSLVRGPVRLRLVDVVDARLNLDATLPASADSDPQAPPPESIPLVVERLRVANASAAGSAPGSARELLERWRVFEVEADGSFDGRRLDLASVAAEARIDRRADSPIEVRIEAEGGAELTGAVDLERLLVAGDGLALESTLRLASDWEQSAGTLRLEADLGTWLGEAPTGRFSLDGEVDLANWEGRARLQVPPQPGSLLSGAGLVDYDLAERLELASTRVELAVDLELAPGAGEGRAVTGAAEMTATRAGARLLELDARPTLALGAGALFDSGTPVALNLGFDARVFPEAPGARTIRARLTAPDAGNADGWRLEDGRLEVEEPSLARLLTSIAELWPRLLAPETVRELPRLGALSARADFGGAVADPRLQARARLLADGNGRVEVTAEGQPLASEWSVDAVGTELSIAQFTEAASGTVDFTARARGVPRAPTGTLELQARGLSTGAEEILSALTLGVEAAPSNVSWRLDAALADHGLVRGVGTLRPENPLRAARGELAWETGDDRFPRLDASFALLDGVLSVNADGAASGEPTLEALISVPLKALDALPQLGDLSAVPLARSTGPVTVAWSAADRSWTSLLPPSWAQRFGRLEAGSTGSLSLDLACPACSSGTAELRDLVVELDGRRAQAESDLVVRLEEGTARLEPWSLTGAGFDLDLAGGADLSTPWRLGEEWLEAIAGTRASIAARLDATWLESLPVEVVTPGTVALSAEVSGPPGALTGAGSLAAPLLTLRPDALPTVVAGGAAGDFRLADGVLEWRGARVEINEGTLESEGRTRISDPLAETSGTLTLTTGLPVVTAAALPFEIREGLLVSSGGRLATTGGDGAVSVELPIDGRPGATAEVEWELPRNDWMPLLARLGAGEDPQVFEAASQGRLALPIDRPATARARLAITDGRIVARDRETVIEPTLELSLADGGLEIVPFTLRTADQSFRFEADAELLDGWRFGDEPDQLIERFELAGRGEIDSGLLNPFLAGGRAEGTLELDLAIGGSPEAVAGRLRAEGPSASILFRTPYLARLESPSVEVVIDEGLVTLERATLRLNEGRLELSGLLSDAGRTDLGIEITDSVFRLDYGLLVTLGADLRYRSQGDGEAMVVGVLDVERGALTRNVQLDLDLLSQLLAPIDLTTTEDDPLDLIALEVEVRTREGVRVKNNLGDLLVRWEPLAVTGTLARPILEGNLEVDPGGLLYAYGQTVRLDKASIEYPGQEGVEPRLDFEATTSLEDPTIGQLAGADPFKAVSRKQSEASTPATSEVTADLARFYGEQFAGKVGESVGVSVSLRPLLIFGETDPGARLTVSRDLSPNLALAASIDLRGAEARTYLLELHELRAAPRLVGQAFTDDQSAYGGALLQRQEWGGSREEVRDDLPRISKIVSEPPQGVSKRGIKRALGLEKGDYFGPDQRFVAEVELVDYLLRKGYPDARVSVRAVPDARRDRRVRLEIGIQPGPRVEFVFEGEKVPKPLRPLITSLYRPDFFERESIEEMRAETVRALRSRGFLAPEVDILVEPVESGSERPDRRVIVRAEGGLEISPDPPVFLGLPPEDVEVLDLAFANAVQRVELAVGLPSADRRLLSTLAAIGYPEARIQSRYQTLGERILTVEVDPGPRERIESVAVEGASDTDRISEEEIVERLLVDAGDPLRRARLSRSAVAVERYLGTKGYLDARVRPVIETVEGDPFAKSVRFMVEPGQVRTLEAVEFEGLRSTRERVARRVADLETGAPLAEEDLSRARTSLWRTGLFSGVQSEVIQSDSGLDRVVFDLEERDRYRLTYGIRWDSEDGMGAVVDATDDNFLGRGWTLGLRALTSSEEDSLRALGRVPRAFGGRGSLELFAAARQLTEVTTDLIFGQVDVPVEVLESTLQYSHPVTDRTTFRVYGRYTDTTRELPFFTLEIRNPQLGFQYVYDSRSPEPLTQRGIFASVDLSGSREFLGGDLAYVRTFSQLSLFRPAGRLFGSRLTWSQSYRLGLAEAFDQELTRDVRFFAGGEYSVRGYETESLGAQETFGAISEAVGGAALLVINQELRWRLFEDYSLVLFADAGNVWESTADLGSNLFVSGGLGARAVTPVGLLRLDIARPFDGRVGIDPEYKIYFGLGTSF